MIAEEFLAKIKDFVRANPNGVDFDTLDDRFHLLLNPLANISPSDDFDKMYVGSDATITPLFEKIDCRYYVVEEDAPTTTKLPSAKFGLSIVVLMCTMFVQMVMAASHCRYCDSEAYGRCQYSPTGYHEHIQGSANNSIIPQIGQQTRAVPCSLEFSGRAISGMANNNNDGGEVNTGESDSDSDASIISVFMSKIAGTPTWKGVVFSIGGTLVLLLIAFALECCGMKNAIRKILNIIWTILGFVMLLNLLKYFDVL